MKISKQTILRDGVCKCGCHGEDHRTRCKRTVRDVIEVEPRDAYPGVGTLYKIDARGWIKYSTQRVRVRRIRWYFEDGSIAASGFWVLGGVLAVDQK